MLASGPAAVPGGVRRPSARPAGLPAEHRSGRRQRAVKTNRAGFPGPGSPNRTPALLRELAQDRRPRLRARDDRVLRREAQVLLREPRDDAVREPDDRAALEVEV